MLKRLVGEVLDILLKAFGCSVLVNLDLFQPLEHLDSFKHSQSRLDSENTLEVFHVKLKLLALQVLSQQLLYKPCLLVVDMI